MGARRYLFGLWSALFFLNAAFAGAASDASALRVKVLSAETRGLNGEAQTPRDCALANYSAYCNGTSNPSLRSIMLVQDADGNSYRIACTAESRWSKCAPLPVGETFEARKGKHGITILYPNAKGKESKQFYQFVAAAPEPESGNGAGAQPPAAAPPQNAPAPAPAPAPAAAPALPPAGAQGGVTKEVLPEKVRCGFSSTPSGAEITLDGQYVGSTPSVLGVGVGRHVVEVTLPGFVQWKRELTVSPGSELTVNAVLQKVQ